MSLGFTAGLVADLGSAHPAGGNALMWLAVGTVCGMARDPRRRRPAQAAVAGTVHRHVRCVRAAGIQL